MSGLLHPILQLAVVPLQLLDLHILDSVFLETAAVGTVRPAVPTYVGSWEL